MLYSRYPSGAKKEVSLTLCTIKYVTTYLCLKLCVVRMLNKFHIRIIGASYKQYRVDL